MNQQKLLAMLPNHFAQLKQMKEIAKVEGNKFDVLDVDLNDLLDQVFIKTATWSLNRWEKQFLLPVLDESKDYEYRRKQILTAKRSNKADLIDILRAIEPSIELAWGGNILPFTIESTADRYDFGELIRVLEHEKPSHLSYSFAIKPNGYTVKVGHTGRYQVALRLLSGTAKAGRYPINNTIGRSLHRNIGIQSSQVTGIAELQRSSGIVSNGKDVPTAFGSVENESINIISERKTGSSKFNPSGSHKAGHVVSESVGSVFDSQTLISPSVATGNANMLTCGSRSSGEEVA